jgi:hypothetical protein
VPSAPTKIALTASKFIVGKSFPNPDRL